MLVSNNQWMAVVLLNARRMYDYSTRRDRWGDQTLAFSPAWLIITAIATAVLVRADLGSLVTLYAEARDRHAKSEAGGGVACS
jgi:hypothetical protein